MDRSYLFVPGDRPERFDKAFASAADAVIVDLEDAVSPDAKDAARAGVAAWLSPARPVLLRINARGTAWFAEDLRLARHPGVRGVVLPKAESADAVEEAAAAGRPILPLIESGAGLDRVSGIAAAAGVQRLVFGSIDFMLDLGLSCEEDELAPARFELVRASRRAGLQAPVDGVTTAIDDLPRVKQDALRARRLGFGGKLCIHPRQVEAVNAALRPTEEELAWARRVAQAAAAANGAAVALDGRMVDRPVILRAQALLTEPGARTQATD
jgi:citrate lyase subunit beta/citryl-CoA lyase